ncbi:SLEI domain protein, PF07620 family [Leptospira interrogans str. FPW1039]|uniref:SLEI domain protein, PF07620 family n=3 Tax=Leptospira interrogans TaxID=173 RepID=A0A0E2DCQ5_LEPIR|nr:hypothetical protein G436_1385 [Leptospira interrogans serovar Hardjo str. Norma]EJO80211.1 SLEI domain protein, PF07620 family [Leptospira interrogans serovar Pomona str. Kennewicki LC82-25]EKN96783.1 SLEI motif protein [Leptospira interrogans serovar Pomona str. Pomona]EKO95649.1 SLEI domain protein, PF07620 family [Leptospira interrogans str. Brem 329]EKR26483.1 SLEI domain protein, PF07620 family [Leptospira interrogans serovar Bataviae str. L1111]EKR37906.1 SLEI domain protein, PF07620
MKWTIKEILRIPIENFLKTLLRACPKSQKILHDNSLEIFNKMQ